MAYTQISDEAEQIGVSPDVDHDYLMAEYTVRETGFIYVYVSNNSPMNVYFDDVTITHTPTNVKRYNACPPKLQRRREYYPFGLQTENSWTRADNRNNFLYNGGSELNQNTAWYETMFRGYDAALGRFHQVDPLASASMQFSPYAFAFNDPVFHNDPSGAYPPNTYEPMSYEYDDSGGGGGLMPSFGPLQFGQHFYGPGSGNHWSDQYRNGYGMSAGDFIASAFSTENGGFWSNGFSHYYSNQEARDVANNYYFENHTYLDYSSANSNTAPTVVFWQELVSRGDQQVADRTNFAVKHSALDSFGWDWFVETTHKERASVTSNYYIQTAVIIVYNTDPKDWGTSKYGQVVTQIGRTRSLIMDAGGLHPYKDLPYSPSRLMDQFIEGAKDYHCGGCLSSPGVLEQYWNFILTPKEQVGNPLPPNGVPR